MGWVSDKGREFAAVGQVRRLWATFTLCRLNGSNKRLQEDGTAFVEILKSGKISYLGRLPQQSAFSRWREMKSYREYMLIGSEAVNHGVQFFDMKKLLDVDPRSPKNFSTSTDLAGFFNDMPAGRSHNVVVVRGHLNYSQPARTATDIIEE